MDLGANAARFSGFAGLYDQVRPTPPAILAELLVEYAGVPAPAVVDLGSGTGLSSRWAAGWASTVIGVEPSDDMRARAEEQAGAEQSANLSYVAGWSHATGLQAESADVVLAVQAFHWMEPTGTLAEVTRVLRPGGVFAAVDSDFPPVLGDERAEAAWVRCRATIRAYEARLAAGETASQLQAALAEPEPLPSHFARDPSQDRKAVGVQAWSKDAHLERMQASGRFRFCRELVVHAVEPGDAARFIALLASQGDLQTLRKHGLGDAQLGMDDFEGEVRASLGDGIRPFCFSYRVRLAIR